MTTTSGERLETIPSGHIKPAARTAIERRLGRLNDMGYLGSRPDRIDGRMEKDKGAQRALREFLDVNDCKALTPKAIKTLRDQHDDLYFSIRVLNPGIDVEPKDEDTRNLARKHPERLPGLHGEHLVCWSENIHVRLAHEHSKDVLDKPREYCLSLELVESDVELEPLTTTVMTRDKSVVLKLAKSIRDALEVEDRATFPVSCKAKLVVTWDNPYRPGQTLRREQALFVHRLKNVVPVRGDRGREWLISDLIAESFLALKKDVNTHEPKAGRLVLGSTVRTWDQQLELWVRFRRGDPKQNPANQPGTSWHEAGRAIDINVWQLGLEEGAEPGHREQLERPGVLTNDIEDIGPQFLRQLDQFRRMAIARGFGLAGREWERTPWNRGYPRTRRLGRIVDARHGTELNFVLHMVVDMAASHPYPRRLNAVPACNAQYISALRSSVLMHGAVDERTPKVIDPEGMSAPYEIVWTVEAKAFGDASLEELQEECNRGAKVVFTWKNHGRTRELVANVERIEPSPEIHEVLIEPDGFDPYSDESVPIPSEVRIGTRSSLVEVKAISAPVCWETGQVMLEIRDRDLRKHLPDVEPSHLVGMDIELITENRRWYKDDQEFSAIGRQAASFGSGRSEKHHFQNTNDIKEEEGLAKVVEGLNAALDAFQAKLDEIDAEKRTAIKKRWHVNKYSPTSVVLKAALYIGNVPDPDTAKASLLALADKIIEEAKTGRWPE